MNVTLNGSPRPLAGPTTLGALLEELGLDAARVAVEHNLAIVPRDRFAAVLDGARLQRGEVGTRPGF